MTFSVYPSILSDSLHQVQEQLDRLLEVQQEIQTVQVDIIDGQFADNLTITPIDLLDVNTHDFSIDFHLMVDEPIDYVFECKQVEHTRAVIAQIERMTSQSEYIQECLAVGVLPGLSLDLYTPVESIGEDSWDELKVIQVMGNKSGIQGQEFAGEVVLEKIRTLSEFKKQRELQYLEIIVDIGVNDRQIHELVKAGATGGAPGSYLWKSEDLPEAIGKLRVHKE